MKLPFSFGSKLFFRVVFPGAIISIALIRITISLLSVYQYDVPLPYVLTIQMVIFGWLFAMLDQPIYMLCEGRRYWPSKLFKLGIKRERGRLLNLHRAMRRNDVFRLENAELRKDRVEADRLYLESAVDLSGFPLNLNTSLQGVLWPTRLGNLIAAYEQYPRIKYGLDSVFYWPRIWVSLDKNLRDEIDIQQAQADGLLYAVIALFLSSFVFLLYAVLDWLNPGLLVPYFNPAFSVVGALICSTFAYTLYRASLFSHAYFGNLFEAVFDQHRSVLKLDEVIELVAAATNDASLQRKNHIVKNVAAWRFLKWHRVRTPFTNENRRVKVR